MANKNDFLTFAVASGSNVLSQSDYAARPATATGFINGIAESAAVNKTLRQTSTVTAMIGQFVADYSGNNAVDDGNVPNLEANFLAALRAIVGTVRYQPGQIVVTAGQGALPGTLICNGAAVSRSTYSALFAAIGTTFGVGDGSTTFVLPNFASTTTLRAAASASEVGKTDVGSLLSHTHAYTITSSGNHTHTAGSANAGGHSHTASSDSQGTHSHSASSDQQGNHAHSGSANGVGDHNHSAWTDQQGNHAHTGGTSGVGDHQHAQDSNTVYNGYNTSLISYRGENNAYLNAKPGPVTGAAGGHSHSLNIDANGNHGHNVGIGNAGAHSHGLSIDANGAHSHNIGIANAGAHQHNITVNAVGDHSHAVTTQPAGDHSHQLSIAAFGGNMNLPAGINMLFCIAY